MVGGGNFLIKRFPPHPFQKNFGYFMGVVFEVFALVVGFLTISQFVWVIPTEPTKASGGISKNARSVFGGVNTQTTSSKMLLYVYGSAMLLLRSLGTYRHRGFAREHSQNFGFARPSGALRSG
jgi:hypothetical protein